MPNLNVGLVAAVFTLFFYINVVNAVTDFTYVSCYEILETCNYHATQDFVEYGSEDETIEAMCGNYEVGTDQSDYCRTLCEYSIYQVMYDDGSYNVAECCGPEYCGPGYFLSPDLNSKEFYYNGAYHGYFTIPGCAPCDYSQYQPNDYNQEGASSCLACPNGYHSSMGSADCTVCPSGTYYDYSRILENEGYPCFPCPEFEEGDVALGSVPTSSDKVLTEQCYVPKNAEGQDSVGTWVFVDDCYYVDENIALE